MSFDSEKHKGHNDSGHEWVAFSDLYLCLSTVFLFLFVVASLRTGTTGVQAQMEVQRLARQNEDLKQQMKVYETLKNEYLEKDATKDDQEVYTELMDKLTLLKDEAKQEKDSLRQQAKENEKKEMALNKYQQLIRNIINNNMISAARIKRRDTTIAEKNEVITEKTEEIQDLETDVAAKKQEIESGERKISQMNSELEKRMKQLKRSFQNNQITKKKFDEQAKRLRQETLAKVDELKQQNEQIENQLADVNNALNEKAQALASAESTIQAKDQTIQAKNQEAGKLKAELEGAEAKKAAQIAALKEQFEGDKARERGEFEAELGRQKLGAAARAAKEAEFRAAADAKARALGDKISALNSQLGDTQGELAKAQELANARKNLASKIKQNFAKAGIKASVDEGTGDVILDFGDQYFETGRADLKPAMQSQLEKTMPVYSASLFNDPKIASKIQGIEIVGFASPTYKGRFIDPASLNPDDRKAVDYNLDLSYTRAKSIFNFVFDTKKISFKHQKDLLPLVKVTGRSFLAETKGSRSPSSPTSGKEFCSQHDCRKAQRVIIKFNLGE